MAKIYSIFKFFESKCNTAAVVFVVDYDDDDDDVEWKKNDDVQMIHISIFIFIHSSIQSLFYYHDGCSVYFHEMKIPMNSIIWRFYFLGEFCLAFGDGGAGGG